MTLSITTLFIVCLYAERHYDECRGAAKKPSQEETKLAYLMKMSVMEV